MIFNTIYHTMSIKLNNMYNYIVSSFISIYYSIYYCYFATPEPLKPSRQNAVIEDYEGFIDEIKKHNVNDFYDLSSNFNNHYNDKNYNYDKNNHYKNNDDKNNNNDKNYFNQGILRANTDSSIYYNYNRTVDLD